MHTFSTPYHLDAPKIDLPEGIDPHSLSGRRLAMTAFALQCMAAQIGCTVDITFGKSTPPKPRGVLPIRPIAATFGDTTYQWVAITDPADPMLESLDLGGCTESPFGRRINRPFRYRAFALIDAQGSRVAAVLYDVHGDQRWAARRRIEASGAVPPADIGRLLLKLETTLRYTHNATRDDYRFAEVAHLIGTEVLDDLPIVHTAVGWDIRVCSADSRRVIATRTGAAGTLEFTEIGALEEKGFRMEPMPAHVPGLHRAIISAINAGAFPGQPARPDWSFFQIDEDGRAHGWADKVLATATGPDGETVHLLDDGASVIVLTKITVRQRNAGILANVDGPYAVAYWATKNGEPSGRYRDEEFRFGLLNRLRRENGFKTEWTPRGWRRHAKDTGAAVKAGQKPRGNRGARKAAS